MARLGNSPRSSMLSTMEGSSPSRPITITFLGNDGNPDQDSFEGLAFEGSVGAGAGDRRTQRTTRKNAAATLFQKIRRSPSTLASPEVTVITWSGPAYSASNSGFMDISPPARSRCFMVTLPGPRITGGNVAVTANPTRRAPHQGDACLPRS